MESYSICLLRLAYFTYHNDFKVYPDCFKRQDFLILRLTNISCMYMPRFLYPLICLSVDIWVASNSELQWIMPQQSSWVCKYLFEILFSLLLNIYPEVGWLDHMVVLFLFFWGTSTIFYSCCTILHSHQQHMGSNLHIFVILHIVFLDNGHPIVCEISHGGFDLHFLD